MVHIAPFTLDIFDISHKSGLAILFVMFIFALFMIVKKERYASRFKSSMASRIIVLVLLFFGISIATIVDGWLEFLGAIIALGSAIWLAVPHNK